MKNRTLMLFMVANLTLIFFNVANLMIKNFVDSRQ